MSQEIDDLPLDGPGARKTSTDPTYSWDTAFVLTSTSLTIEHTTQGR